MPEGTLVFDIETHSSNLLFTLPPEEFVRLIGYRWVGGQTQITTDLEEIRERIRQARWIVGHNIHSFDLPAVFGVYSDEPITLAKGGRVYDTWTHAKLVHPAPAHYVSRFGKNKKADKPDLAKSWFALDEQAYQLGVGGKTDDLKELAKEYVDTTHGIEAAFGRIPVDDQRYVDYLKGDVEASENVAQALLKKGPLDDYALREQAIDAITAVVRSNGIRVDQEAARARRDHLRERRDEIMDWLVENYDFPTEGKSPWATDKGKEAIFAALADQGITPGTRPDWPWTKSDNPSPQLGGKVLQQLTKGTPAEDLGNALAELKGQRSLSQLALDCTHPDGFVHPDIDTLQRSGRWSTTNPGMTIWTNSGEGLAEKEYFIPDNEDEVLLEFDYSNADARIVAALSGDDKYAERFQPGADGHMINAWAAWGKEVVGTDRHNPTTETYRQKAKPLGHGWSYGGGPTTLSRESGVPFKDCKTFCDGMNKQFSKLVNWQNRVRRQIRNQRVYNEWGRPMYVDPGKEFTQIPALHGQSGTREIICDALLGMPLSVLRKVKIQVHDALLMSVPRQNWEECRDYVVGLMQTRFKPAKGGQWIDFPVDAGQPGETWREAVH